jgi:hypothetical protein
MGAVHVALPHPPELALTRYIGPALLGGSDYLFAQQVEPVQAEQGRGQAARTIPRAFNSAWISAGVMMGFAAPRLQSRSSCDSGRE